MIDLELDNVQRELQAAQDVLATLPGLDPQRASEAMRRATIHVRMAQLVLSDCGHGAALRLGLNDLTITERNLFDCLYSAFPQAVPIEVVMTAVDALNRDSLKTHCYRARGKLARHGWLLITQHSALRLVEPTHVVDVDSKEA